MASMTYSDLLPSLVACCQEAQSENPELSRTQFLRWCHYNIYSIPWRSWEVLDVFRQHSNSEDLAGCRVLDLGCGLGAMALYFLLDANASSVVGMDVDIPALKKMNRVLAAHRLNGLRLVAADLAHEPSARNSYDLIVSYDSYYYLGIDRREVAKQNLELLRDGGTLIIKVVNRLFPPYGILSLPGIRTAVPRILGRTENASGRRFGIVQPNAPTSVGLARLLRNSGFTDVAVYNRISRRSAGMSRWFLPDMFVAARKGSQNVI